MGNVLSTITDAALKPIITAVTTALTAVCTKVAPLVAATLQSAINILLSYVLYVIKLLLIQLFRYGGGIIFVISLILLIMFSIIYGKWVDKNIENEYKGKKIKMRNNRRYVKMEDNNGNQEQKSKISVRDYTLYKEQKFKLMLPLAASTAAMIIGAGLCVVSFVIEKYADIHLPNSDDLKESIKPLKEISN